MIIVDSHVPGICPEKFTKQVFVLRCDPRILEKRLRYRGWSEKKIQENVLAEILDICLGEAIDEYGTHRVEQLVTSRYDIESCVRFAKRILSHQKTRKVTVDWLSEVALDISSKYLRR
jgi:adenylate kinase